jgi:hypothetical protein
MGMKMDEDGWMDGWVVCSPRRWRRRRIGDR